MNNNQNKTLRGKNNKQSWYFSTLMESRFMTMIDRLASRDLGTHLRGVCAALLSSYPLGAGVVPAYGFASGCAVRPDQVAPLSRVVREVVANAIEHAHPTHVEGRLRIGCRRDGGGGVAIEVIDDGVGLPEGFDPAVDGDGGLRLARALCRWLGATLSFESTGLGLIVRIALPGRRRRPGALGFSKQ